MFIQSRLKKMERELADRIGERQAKEVMSGCERIDDDTPPQITGEWFSGFAQRLDALKEPATAAEALQCGACAFDDETVEKIKGIYASCGSVREFAAEIMRQQVFGKSLAVKGGMLYITKRPSCECGISHGHDCRYSKSCHCPLANTAPQPVSRLFCNCGGGFYKRLFDELWGADTKVEPVATYIAGDAACIFAVHIPDHIAAEATAWNRMPSEESRFKDLP